MSRKGGEKADPRIPDVLKTRAEELVFGHGHRLGSWHSAKKSKGKGASRAMCKDCGTAVYVLPRGNGEWKGPMIAGKALASCEQTASPSLDGAVPSRKGTRECVSGTQIRGRSA